MMRHDAPTVARLACDEPTARRLAAYLGEIFGADDTVCAAFEGDGGQWQVAIHFRDRPDEADLRALVALAAGEAAAAALTHRAGRARRLGQAKPSRLAAGAGRPLHRARRA